MNPLIIPFTDKFHNTTTQLELHSIHACTYRGNSNFKGFSLIFLNFINSFCELQITCTEQVERTIETELNLWESNEWKEFSNTLMYRNSGHTPYKQSTLTPALTHIRFDAFCCFRLIFDADNTLTLLDCVFWLNESVGVGVTCSCMKHMIGGNKYNSNRNR